MPDNVCLPFIPPNPSSHSVPPSPLPSSLTPNLDTIASLESKFELLVNTMEQIGASVKVFMDKCSVKSIGEVSVEEVAVFPTDSPRQRSLANSPNLGGAKLVAQRRSVGSADRQPPPSRSCCRFPERHWKGVSVEASHLSSSLSSGDSSPRRQ